MNTGPIAVACPYCLSGPDAPCTNTFTGQPVALLHVSRVDAWRKAQP